MQIYFFQGHWLSLLYEIDKHHSLKAIFPTGLVPVWILNRSYKYRVTTIGFKTDTQQQNTKVLSVYTVKMLIYMLVYSMPVAAVVYSMPVATVVVRPCP